jgi:3-hydroxybutyryl-CoA dehydratase
MLAIPKEYHWADLQVGLRHEFQVVITAAMIDRFRDDSGDTNPLHTDAAYARSQGFSGPVVYGLLTASFYSTLAGVYLPGKYSLLHGVDVSFLSPVFIGDELKVSGEVAHLNDAYRQARIEAAIHNSNGLRVSRATLKVGVLAPATKS